MVFSHFLLEHINSKHYLILAVYSTHFLSQGSLLYASPHVLLDPPLTLDLREPGSLASPGPCYWTTLVPPCLPRSWPSRSSLILPVLITDWHTGISTGTYPRSKRAWFSGVAGSMLLNHSGAPFPSTVLAVQKFSNTSCAHNTGISTGTYPRSNNAWFSGVAGSMLLNHSGAPFPSTVLAVQKFSNTSCAHNRMTDRNLNRNLP